MEVNNAANTIRTIKHILSIEKRCFLINTLKTVSSCKTMFQFSIQIKNRSLAFFSNWCFWCFFFVLFPTYLFSFFICKICSLSLSSHSIRCHLQCNFLTDSWSAYNILLLLILFLLRNRWLWAVYKKQLICIFVRYACKILA